MMRGALAASRVPRWQAGAQGLVFVCVEDDEERQPREVGCLRQPREVVWAAAPATQRACPVRLVVVLEDPTPHCVRLSICG